MTLGFKNLIFLFFFLKIVSLQFITAASQYDATFQYYTNSTNLANAKDKCLFWTEVDEGDLKGVFFFVVHMDADIPGAVGSVSSDYSMVLSIQDANYDDNSEYYVERPVGVLRCYFIAKEEDAKDLDPIVDHFTNNYIDRIVDEINFYGKITNKKYFYSLEMDLSIMAWIGSSTHYEYFRNTTPTFIALVVGNVKNIFKLLSMNRNYNESNFFTISSKNVAFTVSNSSGGAFEAGDVDNNATITKNVEIDYGTATSDFYTLYTAGNSSGYDMNIIDVEDDVKKIEEAIRTNLGLGVADYN